MQIGSRVSLGDRLVSITIQRTWAALSRWEKLRLVFELIFSGLFGGKDEAELIESLTEVGIALQDGKAPTVYTLHSTALLL